MKRLMDLVLSSAGLLVVLPVLIVIGTAIWLTDGRPIFFRQERIGLGGKPFKIWKYRTMVRNAESLGSSLTVDRDPRITVIGHWLRKTKLDELPQLLNVLFGEMSLVGPRPEVQRYVSLYTASQRPVLQLKPGITDSASILYFDESKLLADAASAEATYLNEVMPEKIRINLQYAATANIGTDLLIILNTLKRIAA